LKKQLLVVKIDYYFCFFNQKMAIFCSTKANRTTFFLANKQKSGFFVNYIKNVGEVTSYLQKI